MHITQGRLLRASGGRALPVRVASARFVAALMIVALVLSGCSLYNPHVRPSIEARNAALIDPNAKFHGTLPKAIEYANLQRDLYYNAVGDQSRLRSSLALTLAPLTAVALYLGITSSSGLSRDVITGLGIGGATAFGLGTFFESKTRQKVYLEGSRVIGCAIIAMGPVLMTEDDYSDLTDNLKGIGAATAKVDQRISRLEGMIADPAALNAKWGAEAAGFRDGGVAQIAGLVHEKSIRLNRVNGLTAELKRAQSKLDGLRSQQQPSYQQQTAPLAPVEPTPLIEGAAQTPVLAAPSSETLSAEEMLALEIAIEQAETLVETLTSELGDANTALVDITSQLGRVRTAYGDQMVVLRGSIKISNAKLQQRIKEAKVEIAAAKKLKAAANTASGDGSVLRDRVDKAGLTLTTTVENIRDKVSLELVKTEPTLASITSITDNLGSLASKFAGTELILPTTDVVSQPEAVAATGDIEVQAMLGTPPDTPAQRIEAARLNLQAAELELATAANAVTELVTRAVEASQTAGAITSCQVQAVASDFKVEPDTKAIELKKPNGTYQFVVSGGVGIPSAVFFGERTKGMKAKPELEGGSYVIKISMETGEGAPEDRKYQLRISDATGTASKTVEVNVLPADPPQPDPPQPNQGEDESVVEEFLGPSDITQSAPEVQPEQGGSLVVLDSNLTKALQEKLGVTVDGVIGPETTGAIKSYQKRMERNPTGRLTVADVEELLDLDLSAR